MEGGDGHPRSEAGGDAGSAADQDGREEVCPRFHAAVELIGRRWAGAIVFTLISGPRYFRELAASVPGLSDRLLSQRLRELEAEGIVAREVEPGPPARVAYSLTDLGRGLEPVVAELERWAQRWDPAGDRGSSAGDS